MAGCIRVLLIDLLAERATFGHGGNQEEGAVCWEAHKPRVVCVVEWQEDQRRPEWVV